MAGRWPLVEALLLTLVWAGLLCALAGCSSGQAPVSQETAGPAPAAPADSGSKVSTAPRISDGSNRGQQAEPDAPREHGPAAAEVPREQAGFGQAGEGPLLVPPDRLVKPRTIDEPAARAAGIRKIEGRHLTLYTDLPSDPEIDLLPRVFDQALPQWCAYFHIDPEPYAAWRMNGFLIGEKLPFVRTGLLPADLPPFRNGYARGGDLWLYEQPTAYYRRHLLLHEGTHGFMEGLLGSAGPPWYMEGMAELLGTHAWRDGRLTLGHFPQHRDEVPMLGRIKIVQDAFADKRAKTLGSIFLYDTRAHLENEPYGWCWAAAAFLDGHPRYRDRFRGLYRHVRDPNFTERFLHQFRDDWADLNEEWQLFVAALEHGHDIERTVLDFTPGVPLTAGSHRSTIAADQAWQNSGVALEAGKNYLVTASGRYQVADQPKVWWCEPGGVTIEYHNGRPLGMLLGAVRPDESSGGASPLLRPFEIGLSTTLQPRQSGTLFLQINESPSRLADNAGQVQVEIAVR